MFLGVLFQAIFLEGRVKTPICLYVKSSRKMQSGDPFGQMHEWNY